MKLRASNGCSGWRTSRAAGRCSTSATGDGGGQSALVASSAPRYTITTCPALAKASAHTWASAAAGSGSPSCGSRSTRSSPSDGVGRGTCHRPTRAARPPGWPRRRGLNATMVTARNRAAGRSTAHPYDVAAAHAGRSATSGRPVAPTPASSRIPSRRPCAAVDCQVCVAAVRSASALQH